MGAAAFRHYTAGADVATAFRQARDEARFEHGHGGYSATIVEKDSYVVITGRLKSDDEASAFAGDLIERRDPRIDDTWGPAGAVPVKQPIRTLDVPDLPGPGHGHRLQADDRRRVTGIARGRGLLVDGETVTDGWWNLGTGTGTGTGVAAVGVARRTVAKSAAALAAQTRPDGWLFFGVASS